MKTKTALHRAPTVSASALNRLLNVYDWDTTACWEALLQAARRKHHSRLRLCVDLTGVLKTSRELLFVRVYNDVYGIHLVVLYAVYGTLKFPVGYRVYRGKGTPSPVRLAMTLLATVLAEVKRRFDAWVLADSGFEFVVRVRATRHTDHPGHVTVADCAHGSWIHLANWPWETLTLARVDRGERTFFSVTSRLLPGNDVAREGAQRSAIESFFKEAKHGFGLNRFARRTAQGLDRWGLLDFAAFTLAMLCRTDILSLEGAAEVAVQVALPFLLVQHIAAQQAQELLHQHGYSLTLIQVQNLRLSIGTALFPSSFGCGDCSLGTLPRTMKAIIPAAGYGTRMRPLTFTRPKPVLNVAGQPIIVHAVKTLQKAGISQIGIVVSDVTRPALEQAVEDLPGVDIEFIEQPEMLGLGNAVLMARQWVGNDDVCVYLGDNLFEDGVGAYVDVFNTERPVAVIGLVEVENPTAFGVAELDGKRITRLVEKPKNPPSNLAVAGVYCFSNAIFDQLASLKPSPRGEYEIPDAIQGLIDSGATVLGQTVQGWWKDTGQPRDLIDANRLLLEKLEENIQGTVEESRISGRVCIAPTARVARCKIVGPAMIGEGVVLEDTYVGPFTSIGAGTVIRNSEVEHSVIEQSCVIENVETRLQDCLIGLRAVVRGGRRIPRTLKLTLSDASIVELT